ncbi:MAG: SPASM domain-containing protein [Lachnospiraceae bacterium]|nr:SPASM domain-containing protein [Lachnospiraceae bacterium]
MEYGDSLKEKFLAPILSYVPFAPRVVSLEVTTRCQLDCIYCTKDKNQLSDLDINKTEASANNLENIEHIIICGIGESFCYPKIYELIWKLSRFKIWIITNGGVPIDFKKLNKEKNVKSIIFSIDTASEEDMNLICRNYNFNILSKNLSELIKHPDIVGSINSTINHINLFKLENLISFSRKNNLQAINFSLPIGEIDFIKSNSVIIRQQMKNVVKKSLPMGVIISNFYRVNCNTKKSIVPNIRINGDIFPCCNGLYKGVKIGNIYHDNLGKVWNEKAIPVLSEKQLCNDCTLIDNLITVIN